MPTITYTTKLEDVLANATSVVLADPTGTYGIKRNDTGATVVAVDTALTNTATGTYAYDFSAPAEGVTYTAWIKVILSGSTAYHEIIFRVGQSGNVTDYCADTVVILDGWKEEFGIYRKTVTYDDAGKGTEAYALNGTFDGDWQPVGGATMRQESGLEQKSDAIIIGPCDTDILADDKVIRSSDSTTWYVNYVRNYEDHDTIYIYKEIQQ